MEKVVNRFYRDFPICYKSYRVVENKIILTFINLYFSIDVYIYTSNFLSYNKATISTIKQEPTLY